MNDGKWKAEICNRSELADVQLLKSNASIASCPDDLQAEASVSRQPGTSYTDPCDNEQGPDLEGRDPNEFAGQCVGEHFGCTTDALVGCRSACGSRAGRAWAMPQNPPELELG